MVITPCAAAAVVARESPTGFAAKEFTVDGFNTEISAVASRKDGSLCSDRRGH